MPSLSPRIVRPSYDLPRQPQLRYVTGHAAYGPDTIRSHESTSDYLQAIINGFRRDEAQLRADGRIANTIVSSRYTVFLGEGTGVLGDYEEFLAIDAAFISDTTGDGQLTVQPTTCIIRKFKNDFTPLPWVLPAPVYNDRRPVPSIQFVRNAPSLALEQPKTASEEKEEETKGVREKELKADVWKALEWEEAGNSHSVAEYDFVEMPELTPGMIRSDLMLSNRH